MSRWGQMRLGWPQGAVWAVIVRPVGAGEGGSLNWGRVHVWGTAHPGHASLGVPGAKRGVLGNGQSVVSSGGAWVGTDMTSIVGRSETPETSSSVAMGEWKWDSDETAGR